jgi:hypothetical protein
MLRVRIVDTDGTPLRSVLNLRTQERPGLGRVDVTAVATREPLTAPLPPTHSRDVAFGLGRWFDGEAFRGGPPLPAGVHGVLELRQREPLFVTVLLQHVVLATAAVTADQDEVVLQVPLAALVARLSSVKLRCVDGETGAPLTEVVVMLANAWAGILDSTIEPDGRVVLSDLHPGLHPLRVHSNTHLAPSVLVLVPPATELDLGDIPLLPHRQLECVALDPSGAEVPCTIQATSLEPLPHSAMQPSSLVVSSSRHAAHPFRCALQLRPGRYLFQVTAKGGLVTLQEVDTEAVREGPLRIQLARGCRLRLSTEEATPIEFELRDLDGRRISEDYLQGHSPHDLYFPPGDYVMTLRYVDGRATSRTLRLGPTGVTLRVP